MNHTYLLKITHRITDQTFAESIVGSGSCVCVCVICRLNTHIVAYFDESVWKHLSHLQKLYKPFVRHM